MAANASSGNVLSGKQLEIPTRPSVAKFSAAAAATGLFGMVYAGMNTLMEESHVSPANRFPVQPDDVMVQDIVMPNDRLSMSFRNSTGAAIVVQWSLDLVPVA